MKPASSASPHAIIMIGVPGAGKSTFADRFAETFQALIVSQTKLQREFDLSNEASMALRDLILKEYLKTKRTIVIDGGADAKTVRDDLVTLLKKAGYQTLVVWVQTDMSEAEHRATKPYPKGSGLSTNQFDEYVSLFDAPHHREKAVVVSGKHTYTSQLKIVLKQLASNPTPKQTIQQQPRPASAPINPRQVRTR